MFDGLNFVVWVGEYKLDGPQWSEISPSAKEFIQRLMHVDPKVH